MGDFELGLYLEITALPTLSAIMLSPSCKLVCGFIFKQSNYHNKEQLSLEYLSLNMDKKTGIQLIDTIAVGHQALVVLNTEKDGNIQEYIFKYTAEFPIKDFSLKF